MQYLAVAPATRPTPATPWNRLSALVRAWWHSYQRNRRLRATVRVLHGLDARTLKDIGLDRSEIESVVHEIGCRPARRIDHQTMI